MIGCIFLLIYFNKDYKNINLTTKNYNKYKNYKYVTLDLREAKLNRLSYKVNDKEYYTSLTLIGLCSLLVLVNIVPIFEKK